MKQTDNKKNQSSSDFAVGLVTFIIFLIFMTMWMYFST